VFTTPGSMNYLDLPSYDAAVSLRRLSPLYIEVDMNRNLAREIKDQKHIVTIQPLTTDKPVGCYTQRVQLTDTGIKIPIDNYILPLDKSSENSLVVHDLLCTVKFDKSNQLSPLGIPFSCILKDNKGYYVWHAVGQKLMQSDRKVAEEFNVKKVYIKPGEKNREGFGYKIQILDDPGSLEEYDIVLDNIPKGLTDNDKVKFTKLKCLFWPGDEVKVTIK
jgi:hypothetical protein